MSQRALKWFAVNLLTWDAKHNSRKFIWKEENDPYRVWVREVLLQQTRVEQALGYYQRFLSHFNSIYQLASAAEEKVLKVWEGVGYYNRCRNIIHTAKYLVDESEGQFPTSYEDLLKLKGIGTYTAAAIMSFCYNAPFAVVDGNVERIITRYNGYRHNIRIAKHKKAVEKIAFDMLAKETPAIYNQAIMDFGATVCTPSSPNCQGCFASAKCVAYQTKTTSILPNKVKMQKIKDVYWIFLLIASGKKIAVQEKTSNKLWKQLSLFPTISFESLRQLKNNAYVQKEIVRYYKDHFSSNTLTISSSIHKQTLSHRRVYARFVEIRILPHIEKNKLTHFHWISTTQLKKHSFPVIIRKYLETR